VKKTAHRLLALLFAVLLCYSAYRVWDIGKNYSAEAQMHERVMEYKPGPGESVNQSVMDLRKTYPDVAGWLTIPNTNIDYPFVRYKDNGFYLRRDLNGGDAAAGTLFMDCRCAADFTSQNTIIYGHHMKNGSMFGTLKAFADEDFFTANPRGAVYLPSETLVLEFFAYLVVKHTDREVYSVDLSETYLAYVEQNARQYRGIGLAQGDRVVTLSTCSYEFNNARMVLLARVAPPAR